MKGEILSHSQQQSGLESEPPTWRHDLNNESQTDWQVPFSAASVQSIQGMYQWKKARKTIKSYISSSEVPVLRLMFGVHCRSPGCSFHALCKHSPSRGSCMTCVCITTATVLLVQHGWHWISGLSLAHCYKRNVYVHFIWMHTDVTWCYCLQIMPIQILFEVKILPFLS